MMILVSVKPSAKSFGAVNRRTANAAKKTGHLDTCVLIPKDSFLAVRESMITSWSWDVQPGKENWIVQTAVGNSLLLGCPRLRGESLSRGHSLRRDDSRWC